MFYEQLLLAVYVIQGDHLGGVVVDREVVGSIIRVIQNTLTMQVMAALLGAKDCGLSILTDWLVSA